MKDTYGDPLETADTHKFDERYEAAIHSLALSDRKRVQQGYASAAIASSMAGGYREKGELPKIVVLARGFCILFAMLLPSLLLIRVVL